MDTQILEEIGLTKTEIKIYLTLLELGESTTTPIIKLSGIHASKVYEFLDKLTSKGLVRYISRSNKKYFSASDPIQLTEFIKDKQDRITKQQKQVENLIPELNSLQKCDKEKIKAETYEGLNGIKSLYNKMLSVFEKGETQYVIGAPRIGNELIEGFLLDWHKKRIKKGIRCKYIYDSDARDYGKIREKMPLTEVRYFKDISSPVWIEIFKNYIFTGHINKHNAVIFLIKDNEIAKTYKEYFNQLWKIAKK